MKVRRVLTTIVQALWVAFVGAGLYWFYVAAPLTALGVFAASGALMLILLTKGGRGDDEELDAEA